MDDNKGWIDNMSNDEIYQRFLNFYKRCNFSFIEVSFPNMPYTVLYADVLDERLCEVGDNVLEEIVSHENHIATKMNDLFENNRWKWCNP